MYVQPQIGVTALELIVVMTIVAILLTTAVPAIRNYSWNLRMQTAMDTLHTDLNLARSSAINQNTKTVVCPSADGGDCSHNSYWQHGWIAFLDLNGDRRRQAGEKLIKQASAVEFLNISSSRSRTYLRFYPNGTAPGSNVSILFCDQRGIEHAGKLVVSNTGRIRHETLGVGSNENCP